MGKADKREVKQGIQRGQQASDFGYGAGIASSQNKLYGDIDPITGLRTGGLIQRGEQERGNLLGGYGQLAETGGLRPGEYENLLQGDYRRGYDRSYLDTYRDLSGQQGGFDPGRLSRISSSTNYLRSLPGSSAYSDVDTGISGLLKGGNYSDVNSVIGSLQDIGRTGGVTSEDISRINRPVYEEFERTGGFSPEDLAGIRGRSAAGAASTYSNLSDALNRERLASGQAGILGSTGLRLARQSAQDVGSNARDTELGISNAVREGRLGAADRIAANQLNLSRLTSGNRLSAYGQAGGLGLQREQAIQDALARAAQLELARQAQENAAQEAAANIDLSTQGQISQARGFGAQGLQSAEERQRALDAENQRYLIGARTSGQQAGLGGLLSTYGSTSGPESFYQELLRNYLGGQTGANINWNQQRLQAGSMPGIGSTIANIAGAGAGILGGLGGLAFGRRQSPNFSQYPYSPFFGY